MDDKTRDGGATVKTVKRIGNILLSSSSFSSSFCSTNFVFAPRGEEEGGGTSGMSNIVRISPAEGNMCNTFDFNGVGTNPTRSGKVLFPPTVPYILYTRKPKMRVGWSNTGASSFI